MASQFHYQEPFPLGPDTTKYRLVTKDHVSVAEFDGKPVLKVAPEGQEVMARIQSMGSLRRILRRVASVDGASLAAGSELSVEGKVVGKVRSAAGPYGLALVGLDLPVGTVCATVSGGVVLGAPAALPLAKA